MSKTFNGGDIVKIIGRKNSYYHGWKAMLTGHISFNSKNEILHEVVWIDRFGLGTSLLESEMELVETNEERIRKWDSQSLT